MTFDQLMFFVTTVEQGGFQKAARHLNVSQPSISNGIKNLESLLEFSLFDRSHYRPELTPKGSAFYRKAKALISQTQQLGDYAKFLATDKEPELSIAVLESANFDIILELLKVFFERHCNTRLMLHIEGVMGAEEKLKDGLVDLAITSLMNPDETIESQDLGTVKLIPVCAPTLVPINHEPVTKSDMSKHVQVIIRDTSQQDRSFGLVEGSPSCTVNDQVSKVKIIRAGLGWGRVPDFMIQDDLQNGHLVALKSDEIKPVDIHLKALRKVGLHGPVARKLWSYLEEIAQRQLF